MTFNEIKQLLKDNGVEHVTIEVEQYFSHSPYVTCMANTSSDTCLIDKLNLTVPDILNITRVVVTRLTLASGYEYTPTHLRLPIKSYEELLQVITDAEQEYLTEKHEQQVQLESQLAYLG